MDKQKDLSWVVLQFPQDPYGSSLGSVPQICSPARGSISQYKFKQSPCVPGHALFTLFSLINNHGPYHAPPYHTIPYHTIPYHTIPYHTISYYTIPYRRPPYHTIPQTTIPYPTTDHLFTQWATNPAAPPSKNHRPQQPRNMTQLL
eukprot:jgi/Botrbrau1/5980/Bobra.104_1s0011.1